MWTVLPSLLRAVCWFLCSTNTLTLAVYSPPVSPVCVCSQWCDVDSVTVTPHRAVCWFLWSTNTLTLAVYSPPVSPACVCSQWCDVMWTVLPSLLTEPCVDSSAPLIHWHWLFTLLLCLRRVSALSGVMWTVLPSLLTEPCVDSSAPLIHWLFTLLLCLRRVSALSDVMWCGQCYRHSSEPCVDSSAPLIHWMFTWAAHTYRKSTWSIYI